MSVLPSSSGSKSPRMNQDLVVSEDEGIHLLPNVDHYVAVNT